MTIDLTSAQSALAYLRSLPADQSISLPGKGECNTIEGDAVRAITEQSANEWASNHGRWEWTAGELVAALDAYRILTRDAASYGADASDWSELDDKVASPYRISDGMATEYADSIEEAVSLIEDWYGYLLDDGKLDELPESNLDAITDLDQLRKAVRDWEDRIAEGMGKTDFAGHGNYYVRAADQAGFNLSIEIRE